MRLAPPSAQTYGFLTGATPRKEIVLPSLPSAPSLNGLTVEIWAQLHGPPGPELKFANNTPLLISYCPDPSTLHLSGYGFYQRRHFATPTAGLDAWSRLTMTVQGELVTFYLDGLKVGTHPTNRRPPVTDTLILTFASAVSTTPQQHVHFASITLLPFAQSDDEVFSSGFERPLDDAIAIYDFTAPVARELISGKPIDVLSAESGQELRVTGVRPTPDPSPFPYPYIDCGTGIQGEIPHGSDYTLEAWLCPAPSAQSYDAFQTILGRGLLHPPTPGPGQTVGYFWGLAQVGPYPYRYFLGFVHPGGVARYWFTTPVTMDMPQHVAISVSQSQPEATLLIDEQQKEQIPLPKLGMPSGAGVSRLALGGYIPGDPPGGSSNFPGGLLRVRIWAEARTLDQIRRDATDYPTDNGKLLADYDLTDHAGMRETSGNGPDPVAVNGGGAPWALTLYRKPLPAGGKGNVPPDLTSRLHALGTETPEMFSQVHPRLRNLDVDVLVAQQDTLRRSHGVWFETRNGLVHLLAEGRDGEAGVVAVGHQPEIVPLLAAALIGALCAETVVLAMGAAILDKRAAVTTTLAAMAFAPIRMKVNDVLALEPNLTPECVLAVPVEMATIGHMRPLLTDATRIADPVRARAAEQRLKRAREEDDSWGRVIKQKITTGLATLADLIRTLTQQKKEDTGAVTLTMLQDRGEALTVDYFESAESADQMWSMLVDGGHSSSELAGETPPPSPYAYICATHTDDDHIMGIWRMLDWITTQDPGADEPANPQYGIGGILINAPVEEPVEGDDHLDPGSFRALLDAYDAGQLSEQERNLMAPRTAYAIVKIANDHGIPVTGFSQGTPIQAGFSLPGTPSDLTFRTFGPSAANLQRLTSNWNPPTDRSEIFNRASVMQLLTYRRKEEAGPATILLTADGWDTTVNGVAKQDIRVSGVPSHVNVLKVPHHGSVGSENADFYHNLTADIYLCSSWVGNGSLPKPEVLRWIVEGQIQRAGNDKYYLYFVLQRTALTRPRQIQMLQALVDDRDVGINPLLPGRNYRVAYLNETVPAGTGLIVILAKDGTVIHPLPGTVTQVTPSSPHRTSTADAEMPPVTARGTSAGI